MNIYAAYYNHEVRKQSSSGGMFSLIASKYEVVYGVTMTEDSHGAEFRRMCGDVAQLRGSKYFQAKIGDTFREVKQDLKLGRRVLFTGTGCQVNGLKMFLQREYDNLLTIDVICHGVPSPKLWDIYASDQEAQMGGKKLSHVNFRCKNYREYDFYVKENELFSPKETDPFLQMFLNDYCLRPACYQCHAKKMKLSDLTIGDFWGIEEVAPELDDGMGTSLVITRTEKGQALFEQLKKQIIWKEVSYEEGIHLNPAEYRSPIRPPERDTFFSDLSSLDFRQMKEKYVSLRQPSAAVKWMRKIKRIIVRIVRGAKGGCNRKASNSDYGLLLTFTE